MDESDYGRFVPRGGEKIEVAKAADAFTAVVRGEGDVATLAAPDAVYAVRSLTAARARPYLVEATVAEQDRDAVMDELRRDHGLVVHDEYVTADASGTPIRITDEIIAEFAEGTSAETAGAILDAAGVVIKKDYGPRSYLLVVTDAAGANPIKVANRLEAYAKVVYAEPVLMNRFAASAVPSDQQFRAQWHLSSANQTAADIARDADVSVLGAWNTTKGRREIVVAVLDDGFDLSPRLPGRGEGRRGRGLHRQRHAAAAGGRRLPRHAVRGRRDRRGERQRLRRRRSRLRVHAGALPAQRVRCLADRDLPLRQRARPRGVVQLGAAARLRAAAFGRGGDVRRARAHRRQGRQRARDRVRRGQLRRAAERDVDDAGALGRDGFHRAVARVLAQRADPQRLGGASGRDRGQRLHLAQAQVALQQLRARDRRRRAVEQLPPDHDRAAARARHHDRRQRALRRRLHARQALPNSFGGTSSACPLSSPASPRWCAARTRR